MQKAFFNVLAGFVLGITLTNSLWVEAVQNNTLEPELDGDGAPGDRAPGGTHHQPIYVPLSRGLDVNRINFAENSNVLTILAPKGTGYTISKQPRLCWHIAKVIKNPIAVAIMYADPLAKGASTEPLLETTLQVSQAGVQVLDLSKYDIELETGVEYEWSVDIVTGERSFNRAISSGMIQRIEQPTELIKKIDNAKEKEMPFIYAQAELWYDAISSLSSLIEKYPNDKTLYQQRSNLFKEMGLKSIVE